jgi:hypothetical protein
LPLLSHPHFWLRHPIWHQVSSDEMAGASLPPRPRTQ